MASRGFTTGMSLAMLTKKFDNAMKLKMERKKNEELIEQQRLEEIENHRWRIRERSEISSALKETTMLSLQAKERLEKRQSLLKQKLRESIK